MNTIMKLAHIYADMNRRGEDTDDIRLLLQEEVQRVVADNNRMREALVWLDKWIGAKTLLECADKVRAAIGETK